MIGLTERWDKSGSEYFIVIELNFEICGSIKSIMLETALVILRVRVIFGHFRLGNANLSVLGAAYLIDSPLSCHQELFCAT